MLRGEPCDAGAAAGEHPYAKRSSLLATRCCRSWTTRRRRLGRGRSGGSAVGDRVPTGWSL